MLAKHHFLCCHTLTKQSGVYVTIVKGKGHHQASSEMSQENYDDFHVTTFGVLHKTVFVSNV